LRIGADYILIKDFFKVLETNDFSFISNKEKIQSAYKDVWQDLLSEYETLSGNGTISKEVTENGKIESLKCKFNAIQIACKVLAFRYDVETINILKQHFFFIDENNYQKEILRIQKESEFILNEIETLEKLLPKQEEKTSNKSQHIDQVILGYCSFVGIQIKPNKCTVTEFASLKNLFESKLKQLEKPKKDVK
tara:strand:- start:5682 stop:6260 length:579 start_codon:yes stop_codon:yes gene_type:complete